MYGHKTDFCVLTFYPSVLLNLLIITVFSVKVFSFLHMRSSANRKFYFIQFGWPFFCCNFQSCWIKVVKAGFFALFLLLEGKLSSLNTAAYVICCGFHMAFYYDEVVPSFSRLAVFIVKGYWILSKAFSASIEMTVCSLPSSCHWLCKLNSSYFPGRNPNWTRWTFNALLNLLC